ncbi:MAG: MnmC family methyltransferase [Nanoarchaeota archaeon]
MDSSHPDMIKEKCIDNQPVETIKTKDGSSTFYNYTYQEHYHTLFGAREEALIKYVEPAKIKDRDNTVILDVCFGLGYNSAAALEQKKEGASMTIIGLEIDPAILKEIKNMDFPFSNKELFVEAIEKGEVVKDRITLKIIVGDILNTIKTIKEKVDVVLFDPFSPKKQPELWTQDLFKTIFELMNPGGILTTYSCAKHIRESMKNAGFMVEDGPVFGRRAPGTVARKKLEE